MLLNNRVIWSDNGTLRDLSVELNDLHAATKVIDFVAAADKLYLGSDLPFNHRYFDLSVLNAISTVASVEIWDGSAWNSAVDVLDLTQGTSGKSLSQSGIIQWTTDKNKTWGIEDSTENIAALSTLKIYGLYWVRLSWTADWTSTTALAYVGHRFANDNALAAKYPDLTRSAVMTAYTSGRTNWNDIHVLAAEEIIEWLRKEQVVVAPSQILGWEMFSRAAVHKAASIIFQAFGPQREDEKAAADKEFERAMNQISFKGIDKDADGHLDSEERFATRVFRRV